MSEQFVRELFAGHDPGTEPPLPSRFVKSSVDAARRRAGRRRVLATGGVAAVAVLAIASGMVAVGATRSADDRAALGSAAGGTVPQPAEAQPDDAVALLARVSLAANEQVIAPRPDQFIYAKYQHKAYGISESWISVDGSQLGWATDSHSKTGGPISYALSDNPHPTLEFPTYTYLTTLPTDPDALLAMVRAAVAAKRASMPADKIPDPDQEVFAVFGELINSSILPPRLGAAIYRAAAKIPGVKLIRDTVDAAGQHDVGVSRSDNQHLTRLEWLFDRTTYDYRGMRYIDLPTRKTLSDFAVIDRAVVDHLPPS